MAQEIPPMDLAIKLISDAKTDAYMMTMYKKKKLKTKTVVTKLKEGTDDRCHDVFWNQEIWLPAQVPII